MTNYENLKAAAQSLGDFCDNHEDCDGCTLSALCECMPAALPKLINAIAENKEKSGGGQEMKRVFAILLTAMLLTGCTSENVRAIQSSSTNITITTYNNYSVQGYTIREIEDGYVVTVEVNPK